MSNPPVNDYLVLVAGASAAGKSASLRGLRNPEGVLYLGCEAGKKLPFANSFCTMNITEPYDVLAVFDELRVRNNIVPHSKTKKPVTIHTVVIDTLTFLMDMYESNHVIGSANGQQAWQNFAQYFKTLMQDKVANSGLNILILAHTLTTVNETEMVMETKVPVKGSLKNQGIEAWFSCVVAAKKMAVKKLEGYQSKLLKITPEEEALGFKYVFQTRLTRETVNERIRSPMALFKNEETFMDNDVQMLLDHLHNYYE